MTCPLSLREPHKPTNSILFLPSCKKHRWGGVYASRCCSRSWLVKTIRVEQRLRTRASPQGAVSPTHVGDSRMPAGLSGNEVRGAGRRGLGAQDLCVGSATGKTLARLGAKRRSAAGFGRSGDMNVTVEAHSSQITHPPDLKEQDVRYLAVFTGMLAGTAFFCSRVPTRAQLNRLQGAASSTGICALSLAKSSVFCTVILLARQVRGVSQLHCSEALLSLVEKQDPRVSASEDKGKYLAFRMTASQCVLGFRFLWTRL